MSALKRILFPAPSVGRTPLELLRWWELRRITFNAAVGAGGLISTGIVVLLSHLPGPLYGMPIPWPGMLAYGFMANICYSAGWVIESLQQWRLGRDTGDLGPMLFRHGLLFSIWVSLVPAVMAWMAWIAARQHVQ